MHDPVVAGADVPPADAPAADVDAPESCAPAGAEAGEDPADEPETGPLRRCVVTRERGERSAMLRFVVAPDGTLVPDLLARLPGRGIWLSAQGDVVETARTRGAFPRAARRPVTVPPDLLASVQAGLAQRVVELTGFARRAGQAVAGYAKAREWLQAGRVGLVLQASDGSPDECRRLLSGARDVPVATPLSAGRLAAVFGRDHVVHVAVAPGRLAGQIAVEARRLAGVMQPLGTTRPVAARRGGSRPDRGGRPADGRAPVAAAGPGLGVADDAAGAGPARAGASAKDAGPRGQGGGQAGAPAGDGVRERARERDDRAATPAVTRDLPTGAPAVRQGGRTVR